MKPNLYQSKSENLQTFCSKGPTAARLRSIVRRFGPIHLSSG